MRSSILRDFQRAALTLGLDPAALMQEASIDPGYLEDPDLLLPAIAFVQLLDAAADASGMEDIGLRFVQSRGLPDLGPVLLLMREEATARDALRTLGELMHLHNGGVYLRLEERVEPIVAIDILTEGETGASRPILDSALATVTHILRWLLGEQWSPALVCMTLKQPRTNASHERFYRCPIDYRQEFNGVVLHPGDLDKRLPASSPAMRRQVERLIRSIDMAPADVYLRRVTQLIARALPHGEARAERVAFLLGADRRTLNRRLARVGQNYSGVVETVRRRLAAQHLSAGARPLSQIAPLVGFESLRAFSRWFHMSFGVTPSEWRQSRQEGPSPSHGEGPEALKTNRR